MNTSIRQVTWHGQLAWKMETESIQTIIVPEMGAKIVSLMDKRNQLEWLIGPGNRDFRPVPYGAVFTDQDMSGWDEMFPTIVSCRYPGLGEWNGTELPDHGEVWALPWKFSEDPSGQVLKLSVEGKALPYLLTRTMIFSAADILQMHYELENLGGELMPYIWAAHPQFLCGSDAEINIPRQVKEVCNTIPPEWGWGEPETRFAWPEALKPDGQRVRIDRTGPASLQQARKFFIPPDMHIQEAGLIRHPSRDWLYMSWDVKQIPYFGLWVDEGAISQETVAALEPTTGYYDSLETAWKKQMVTRIKPGEKHTWVLNVRLGTGDHPFPLNNFRRTSNE